MAKTHNQCTTIHPWTWNNNDDDAITAQYTLWHIPGQQQIPSTYDLQPAFVWCPQLCSFTSMSEVSFSLWWSSYGSFSESSEVFCFFLSRWHLFCYTYALTKRTFLYIQDTLSYIFCLKDGRLVFSYLIQCLNISFTYFSTHLG